MDHARGHDLLILGGGGEIHFFFLNYKLNEYDY